MRLFVAVSLPQEVLEVVEALPRPKLQKLRWTTPDQWHVTLRFLGEVEDPSPVEHSLLSVPDALRAKSPAPVEATLGPAVAWFPGRRVLQVPVTGTEALAEEVSRLTAGFGEPPDNHYSGHLTLARVRGEGRGPANLAGTPVKARWTVGEIVLVASTLGAGGATYEVVEKVPLGA